MIDLSSIVATARMQARVLVTPSCILPRESAAGLGGLFHGGFKAVMNVDFLKGEGVTHVVNTAKGLEGRYGHKYTVSSTSTKWPRCYFRGFPNLLQNLVGAIVCSLDHDNSYCCD